MVKVFSTVILLFLLMPFNLTWARAGSEGSKIFSGYLHLYNLKTNTSLWHAIFSPTFPKHEQILYDWQCLIEFKGPVSFVHQPVTEEPKELSYIVKFKNSGGLSQGDRADEMNAFKSFIIEIYTHDGQVYSIDPEAEGKQVSIDEVHHIFDPYLIYLVLGQDIDHIEVVDQSSNNHDKYVLNNFEIHNDH